MRVHGPLTPKTGGSTPELHPRRPLSIGNSDYTRCCPLREEHPCGPCGPNGVWINPDQTHTAWRRCAGTGMAAAEGHSAAGRRGTRGRKVPRHFAPNPVSIRSRGRPGRAIDPVARNTGRSTFPCLRPATRLGAFVQRYFQAQCSRPGLTPSCRGPPDVSTRGNPSLIRLCAILAPRLALVYIRVQSARHGTGDPSGNANP